MIFNFMAKIKKSGLVPATLHYCGHNVKKIGPKTSLLKIYTQHTLIRFRMICILNINIKVIKSSNHFFSPDNHKPPAY